MKNLLALLFLFAVGNAEFDVKFIWFDRVFKANIATVAALAAVAGSLLFLPASVLDFVFGSFGEFELEVDESDEDEEDDDDTFNLSWLDVCKSW